MAPAASIPLTVLPLGSQRYSCHGCGDCCRDFTVQLRESDLARLQEQGWERELGPVTVEFRGRRYLRQRPDGGCVFLQDDGRCRIHAEHGLEAKPLACQLFPFILAPGSRQALVGVSFACASVLANQGAVLGSHASEVRRLARDVDELAPARTMLDASTEATRRAVALKARLEEDYTAHRFRLERALEQTRYEDALYEVKMITALVSHRRGPYLSALNTLERQLTLRIDQAAAANR